MEKNKTALFGYGVIGKATAKQFKFDIIVDWNKEAEGFSEIRGKMEDLEDCQDVWLCVPTPSKENGECDISAIKNVAVYLASLGLFPTLVIRSTVIPGTAEWLYKNGFKVISFPEFLRQKFAKKDIANPWIVLLGYADKKLVDEFISRHDYFRKFAHKIFLADNKTAELAKYATNSFFATLVVFANQIYDACQKSGANYKLIRQIIEEIPWPAQSHLDVKYEGFRGYAGACLPKDVLALSTTYNLKLLKYVHKLNQAYLQHRGSNI